MKSINFNHGQLSRIFIVTQSANEHLYHKYSDSFNFFQAKSINQIVFNHTSERVTLAAKDITVLVDDTEYLKRSYYYFNQKGKQQIKSRLQLLADFYANADLLKYEYPMMMLTQTDEIFLKRQKRFKQIGNDRGSSDSSNSIVEKQFLFHDESFLHDLEWNDLFVGLIQEDDKKKQIQNERQFQNKEYCIYGDLDHKKFDTFAGKISSLANQISVELIFNTEQNEKEVGYLVLDFDDLDREQVIRQYKKISNKENIIYRSDCVSDLEQKGRFPNKIKSLIDKKSLNSTIHVSFIEQIKSGQSKQNYDNSNLLLGSREEMEQQLKLMRKSTQQLDRKTKSSNRQQMIIQEREKISVLSQFMTQVKHPNPSFQKIQENKNEKFSYNYKKKEKITNLYGKPLMKQSEMASNYQMNLNVKIPKQVNIRQFQKLNYLKQTPPQVPIKNELKKDKQRFRLPLGLIKKQKQDKIYEHASNRNEYLTLHFDEAKILKTKEPEPRLNQVKSGGYFRYSTDREWRQQRERRDK